MKLKNILDQLIGKPISIEIGDCKLFPFNAKKLTLKEHSTGFYCVIGEDKQCIWLIDTTKAKHYTIEFLEDEVSVVKWDGIRIVSMDNI